MFPARRTHVTRDISFPGRGTDITRDMCFPGRGTHITRDMCFPVGEHILLGEHKSVGIYVSHVGKHISLGICVFA